MGFLDRLFHSYNVFKEDELHGPFGPYYSELGMGNSYSPGTNRTASMITNDRTIMTSIINRMASDLSSIEFMHARLDENDRMIEIERSGLHYCLNEEANIDQTPRSFKNDLAQTILSEGVAAVVPVETTLNPNKTGGYDIKNMRVGTISQWFPKHVQVDLYNENTGVREQITLEKTSVAIVENPLYNIMNEPNSTMQRLIRKLTLLDSLDDTSANKKMDVIIQLPYVVKSEARRQQAEQRRQDIEFQLSQSQYGVAYADGTEKITQLNRPVENNLLPTVEYMTQQVYSQLGLTVAVLEGTASESDMLNYHTRTIEPLADAIAEELSRKFLTKTARTRKQKVIYLRRPFSLVPMDRLAEIGDKFTRNEILTSNEVRSMIGFKPYPDPAADELRNSNMPRKDTDPYGKIEPLDEEPDQNEVVEDEELE